MGLPKISISYQNGQLGVTPNSQDGLFALVCGGKAVAETFVLGTPYKIYRLEGLHALGVTPDNSDNKRLYAHVKMFYNEAPEGTPLIVVAYDKSKTMENLCDKSSGEIRNLLQSMKGELRGVIVCKDPETDQPSITEGIDPDVLKALPKAQALAEYATEQLYAPIFIALEGRHFSAAAQLKDLKQEVNNRVCIVIGDTDSKSNGAAMGIFAGRLASIPVQRNIGRVADGPLKAEQMFLGAKAIEDVPDDVAAVYDKGYITPRTYVGLGGYYFSDDRLCVKETDDYAHLANLRVIDKACRIAYSTLLSFMLDEIEVNEDGTIDNAVLKSWQSSVENAVSSQMAVNGELSTSDDGKGCRCFIDPKQNVLSTSTVNVVLQVRPFGYARNINVSLGFQVTK